MSFSVLIIVEEIHHGAAFGYLMQQISEAAEGGSSYNIQKCLLIYCVSIPAGEMTMPEESSFFKQLGICCHHRVQPGEVETIYTVAVLYPQQFLFIVRYHFPHAHAGSIGGQGSKVFINHIKIFRLFFRRHTQGMI